jgi:hypothetical protein
VLLKLERLTAPQFRDYLGNRQILDIHSEAPSSRASPAQE